MYTMSGVTVSEGVSEGVAYVLSDGSEAHLVDVVATFSASDECLKYRRASRDFAAKLNNAANGTVPDKVRDLFGAVASYITNNANINEIDALIYDGNSALDAAKSVLLPKIARFSEAASFDDEDKEPKSLQDQEDDWEMQVSSNELRSLMRDFIGTISASPSANDDVPKLNRPSVIIANDLSPARFLALRTDMVRAVVLEGGQASGHLGTVLRDLCIPAVYEVKGALTIKNGEDLLVDATRGTVLVSPPQEAARSLIEQQDYYTAQENDVVIEDNPAVTVAGSLGAIGEVDHMARCINHGLGLLRSEFLFLSYHHRPTVDEMVATFSAIFNRVPKKAPLTARTFDFAGDKQPLFSVELDESGALRKYGAKVGSKLIKDEIKAMLLASVGREIYIVFPLITRIGEARSLRGLIDEAVAELKAENKPIGNPHPALMIETPAAVLSARAFAAFGEMFVIGTSSLSEYAAAPRPPEEYFTPALAKMIAIACKAARDEGVKVGMAGRFARRTELLPLFLSLGVSYITTDATSLQSVRKELQKLTDNGATPVFKDEVYAQVMEASSARELHDLIFQDNASA
ncbi:MAG: putative PEP-binding protein [Anaerobiospirillum succiniciproducens]|uniref:putative PEP-binding protein n=1 Tax=Anaerobiospirillum succiniciproducens TaxID=13335 RepID=UPI002354455C|nr:putative PEP-binding protein [Anaerobiospirillum succiniciproducens]MCI6863279.1 PEP-utilizing enzyme [Anaerobiospirillum succiniciproducens]MDY2799354.1 putative PEP-binding protein [Anaerobiospirillum succiniciproducens]